MTPRYARLAGWLLLAGTVGTVVACSTPTVDGTDIDSASQGASTGKRTKRTTDKTASSNDGTGSAAPTTTTTSTGAPMTTTTAVPSTTSTAPAPSTTTTTPAPSTSATTPPPAQQPACGSSDPLACLDCCLRANPGAVQFEDNYDACMRSCPQGDNACYDDCQRGHVSECAANASCAQNHACMEANNCLAQNYCNPI